MILQHVAFVYEGSIINQLSSFTFPVVAKFAKDNNIQKKQKNKIDTRI